MPSNTYIIDFVDPTKSPIKVPANINIGPTSGVRKTDIDLIGMGHSLWGETVLENFLHMLENFSCKEDLHEIASIDISGQVFKILGDVTQSFVLNSTFEIIESGGSPNNNGTYAVSTIPTYNGTETTIVVSGSPGLLNSSVVSFGQAGHPDFPDKNLKFSPTVPVEGELWFNQTKQELYVYRAAGSPIAFEWHSLELLQFVLDNYYNKLSIDALETDLRNAIDQAAPVASVKEYAGTSTPPSGWLLCDGSAVSRTTYSDLFVEVGTTYGTGDGTTTFNVPDMRGRVAVGLNPGALTGISSARAGNLNQAGGAEYHTLAIEEITSHSHSASVVPAVGHTHSGNTGPAGNHNHAGSTAATAGSHNHGISWTNAESGGGDNEIISWTGVANGFTGPSGNHTHILTIVGAGDHLHTFTTTLNGAHTHLATTAPAGGLAGIVQPHENTQPFLTLNYIIKT